MQNATQNHAKKSAKLADLRLVLLLFLAPCSWGGCCFRWGELITLAATFVGCGWRAGRGSRRGCGTEQTRDGENDEHMTLKLKV